jgi:hypothetical protein
MEITLFSLLFISDEGAFPSKLCLRYAAYKRNSYNYIKLFQTNCTTACLHNNYCTSTSITQMKTYSGQKNFK